MRRLLLVALVSGAFAAASAVQTDAPAVVRFTYGGNGSELGYAVTTDARGNIYIAGGTNSANLPGSESGFQKTLRGGASPFVAKLDPNGRVVWASYLNGGTGRRAGKFSYSLDEARAIAVDSQGNVYIAGATGSTDFPTTANAFQPRSQSTRSNTYDAFLAKFNATGSELLYSTYIGAPDNSAIAEGLAVGATGDVWVLVRSEGRQFPQTHDLSSGAGGVYLGHFLASGDVASWTRLRNTAIAGLALDRFGQPHVLSHFSQSTSGIELTQLDRTGTRANFTWSLPLPSPISPPRTTADLAVGVDGTIAIVGYVDGSLPVTNPFQPGPGKRGDAFVAILNPQGTPEVVSYLGGSGPEPTQRAHAGIDLDGQLHIAFDTVSLDLSSQRGFLTRHPDWPLFASSDGGESWSWTGTELSAISAFAIDAARNVLYAIGLGANTVSGITTLFRSGDEAATWQPVRDLDRFAFGIRDRLVIDPRDSMTFYAGSSNLYRFDREGESVTLLRQATAGVGGFRVDALAVSPHDSSVWIATGTRIEVSVDRGATWTPRDAGIPRSYVGPFEVMSSVRAIAFDPNNRNTLFLGMAGGIFRSDDAGVSWRKVSRPPPGEYDTSVSFEAMAVDPSDSDRIYGATFNNGILVTLDGGQTLHRVLPNTAVTAIAIDAGVPHAVYAAVSDWRTARSGVMISRDFGQTWTWGLDVRTPPAQLLTHPRRSGRVYAAPRSLSATPFVARLGRDSEYSSSFASYLREGTVSDLTVTSLGETLLTLNTSPYGGDIVVLRIAR